MKQFLLAIGFGTFLFNSCKPKDNLAETKSEIAPIDPVHYQASVLTDVGTTDELNQVVTTARASRSISKPVKKRQIIRQADPVQPPVVSVPAPQPSSNPTIDPSFPAQVPGQTPSAGQSEPSAPGAPAAGEIPGNTTEQTVEKKKGWSDA